MGWLKHLVSHFSLGGRSLNGLKRVRVLAVMPYDRERNTLFEIAKQSNWHLEFAATCESAVNLLRAQQFAVILCDRDLPGCEWRDAMQALVANARGACVILTSPVNDDYLWQEVIQRGGYDVLTRPLQQQRVLRTVELAWSYWTSAANLRSDSVHF